MPGYWMRAWIRLWIASLWASFCFTNGLKWIPLLCKLLNVAWLSKINVFLIWKNSFLDPIFMKGYKIMCAFSVTNLPNVSGPSLKAGERHFVLKWICSKLNLVCNSFRYDHLLVSQKQTNACKKSHCSVKFCGGFSTVLGKWLFSPVAYWSRPQLFDLCA